MLRVQVSSEVKSREFSSGNGKPSRKVVKQSALAHLGLERRLIWLELKPDAVPFAPGNYTYHPGYRVNQYGDLELDGRSYQIIPEKVAKE